MEFVPLKKYKTRVTLYQSKDKTLYAIGTSKNIKKTFSSEEKAKKYAKNHFFGIKGKHVDDAKTKLLKKFPTLDIHLMSEKGWVREAAYRSNRVDLFHNDDMVVVSIPKRG